MKIVIIRLSFSYPDEDMHYIRYLVKHYKGSEMMVRKHLVMAKEATMKRSDGDQSIDSGEIIHVNENNLLSEPDGDLTVPDLDTKKPKQQGQDQKVLTTLTQESDLKISASKREPGPKIMIPEKNLSNNGDGCEAQRCNQLKRGTELREKVD